jgi:hypothetical protein
LLATRLLVEYEAMKIRHGMLFFAILFEQMRSSLRSAEAKGICSDNETNSNIDRKVMFKLREEQQRR